MKVEMLNRFPIACKVGETETHWGVLFTRVKDKLVADIDDESAKQMIEAERVVEYDPNAPVNTSKENRGRVPGVKAAAVNEPLKEPLTTKVSTEPAPEAQAPAGTQKATK